MKTVCNAENNREDFSVTMGVNAFRGFMNEFMALSRIDTDKPSNKKRNKKEKRRWKADENVNFNGHFFVSTIINIPTACEVCNSFFMWPIERSLVCQSKCFFWALIAKQVWHRRFSSFGCNFRLAEIIKKLKTIFIGNFIYFQIVK